MDEYTTKFESLSCFAPYIGPTKEDRKKGLKDKLHRGSMIKFLIERIKTTKVVFNRVTVPENFWIISKQKR